LIEYPRFAHPEHPELFCQPILVSKPTNGAKPIMTIHAHYPRPIHGEIMTHKKFGRNARSSRAVPVRKMLEEVRTKPYVPWHWGANQRGMQAGESFSPEVIEELKASWLVARDNAANSAEGYMDFGVHKQNPNRLLEPFAWIDTLITSTSWANFRWLRDHKDAEPHFRDLARLFGQAMDWIKKEGAYQTLEPGDWHLPYIRPDDWYVARTHVGFEGNRSGFADRLDLLKKISAARCARISYEPFDGDGSFEREMERFELLVGSDRIHASPMEHQATPDIYDAQYPGAEWESPHLAGNLGPGWIQFRKLIPGEYIEDEDWL